MKQMIRSGFKVLILATGVMLNSAWVGQSAWASTSPRDYDTNSIIWGGAYSKTEWSNYLHNGDGHNSAANLQQIYLHEGRGITESTVLSNATVNGEVEKDGDVRVTDSSSPYNGQVVARGATSVGRTYIAGSVRDGSVWSRPVSTAFVASSIPAFVTITGGTFQFAILKSCGNPVKATSTVKPSPTPSASPTPTSTPTPATVQCVSLTPSQPDKDNHPGRFRFTVGTVTTGNPTINGYHFDFSDGTADEDTPADRPYVERTLTSGSLTVKARVMSSVGTTDESGACTATAYVTTASPSPTPTPTPTPRPTPTSTASNGKGQVLGATLPDTGPAAALGGMVGLSAVGVAARSYMRSRRSVLQALRHKISDRF